MRHLLALLAAALLLAACGADDATDDAATPAPGDEPTAAATADAGEAGGEDAFPVTVDAANGAVEVPARPERIVSLSPVATEMLYAVGAGDQVVAVEEYSNFPEGAPVTDLSGFDPNLEAIVGYEPDLVVLSDDANDVLAGLERVGVPALQTPAAVTLDDTYAQLEQVGAATGHPDEAAEVVASMQADVEALVAEVPERDEPPTYYHELGPELYSVTSSTFVGEVYALAGLENVADPADADGQAGGYPQLSAEFLVEADPDVVFLADTVCCGEDAESFAARPGFGELTAVAEDRVIGLDDDVASRWGPRVVELLETVVDATADLPGGDGGDAGTSPEDDTATGSDTATGAPLP